MPGSSALYGARQGAREGRRGRSGGSIGA
jgi:hypothetical protein